MNRFLANIVPILVAICLSTVPVVAQSMSDADSYDQKFELLLPKETTGWNRIQYNNFSETPGRPIIAATYTNSDFPYGVKLKLSYTEKDQRELQHALKSVSEHFGEDAVQAIEHEGYTLYLIQGRKAQVGFAGVAVRAGAMTIKLNPKTKIKATDVETIMAELRAINEALDIEQLADYYTPPIADASVVEVPEGFQPYAEFFGNTQLAFAYPENWSMVDFFNQGAAQRDKVMLSKDPPAVEDDKKKPDYNVLVKNFISGFSGSDNVMISVDRNGKWFKSEGYTNEIIKKMKKSFPDTFDTLKVQPPNKMTIDGHVAFSSILRGSTVNGQNVVMKRIVIKIPKKAVYVVDIFRPENVSKNTQKALDVFFESLTISPRE